MALLFSDGMDSRSVGGGGSTGGGGTARDDILRKYIVPAIVNNGFGSTTQDASTNASGSPVDNGRTLLLGATSTSVISPSQAGADLGAQTGVIRAQFYMRVVNSYTSYGLNGITTTYDDGFRNSHFISFTSDIPSASSSAYSTPPVMTGNYVAVSLRANQMGVKWSGNSNVLLFTASTPMKRWNHYEVEFKFDGASTYLKIWRDNELIVDASGTGSAAGTSVRYFNMHFGNDYIGTQYEYDDLVVWNDAGDGLKGKLTAPLAIRTVRPQAAGSFTDGTPSSGFNFQCVDEQDPNTTDYVSMSVEGQKDTYDFASVTSEVSQVHTVALNILSRSVGTTTNTFRMVAKSGSSLVYSPAMWVPAASSFGVRQIDIPLDPNTGLQWTESGINAAEFGFELYGTL